MTAFPEFGPNAETRQLTADGVTMRVVIEGAGPDVVFILRHSRQPCDPFPHVGRAAGKRPLHNSRIPSAGRGP
jgi:hypothetical protein